MNDIPLARKDRPCVVIAGSLTRDRIVCAGTSISQIGGVVWYAGSTLAGLGVEARVVTRVAAADRDLGRAVEAAGVKVWLGSSLQTTTFINDYTAKADGERTQRMLASADPIEAGDLENAMQGADLIYLGPLHPADLSDGALSLVKHRTGVSLVLDVQGYTRVVRNECVVPGVDVRLASLLDACDIVKASADEACLITGTSEASSAARRLAVSHNPLEVVVTCGAMGAYTVQGDQTGFAEAKDVGVSDLTGAGDVFFASYLAHRMNGVSAQRASELAGDFTAAWLVDRERDAQS